MFTRRMPNCNRILELMQYFVSDRFIVTDLFNDEIMFFYKYQFYVLFDLTTKIMINKNASFTIIHSY